MPEGGTKTGVDSGSFVMQTTRPGPGDIGLPHRGQVGQECAGDGGPREVDGPRRS